MRVCNRSVVIEPGLMALTRTPSLMPRSASALVRYSSAALTEPPIARPSPQLRRDLDPPEGGDDFHGVERRPANRESVGAVERRLIAAG